MKCRHCFAPLRSQKTLVVLSALLVTAAACSPAVTPPGANIAYGHVNQAGYTLLRWQQGLDILVWHDLSGSSWCQGSTSTSDPAYRLRCHAESSDGHQVDWEVQTQNGQTAQFSIDGNAYDLNKGRVFLIRAGGRQTWVVQQQRDLSGAQVEDPRSIEAFAPLDRDMSAFIGAPAVAVQATPTSTAVPATAEERSYDCLAIVSATRSLTANGTGDDCWLTLADAGPAEITFSADAQVTFRTSWGGDDVFFFAARQGDRLIKVTGATIRPARYIARKFDGSIEGVRLFEIAQHSPGVPNSAPACLRDANNDYRPLTPLCK